MMIPEIEADLVAIARDEALLEEERFVPRDAQSIGGGRFQPIQPPQGSHRAYSTSWLLHR